MQEMLDADQVGFRTQSAGVSGVSGVPQCVRAREGKGGLNGSTQSPEENYYAAQR